MSKNNNNENKSECSAEEQRALLLYRNPPHYKELEEEVKQLFKEKKHSTIKELIEKTFPGWLLFTSPGYCPDYPHLQRNWEIICDNTNTTPKEIILVDYINFNSQTFELVAFFAEVMTKFGYVVRRKGEFFGCDVCGKAIPDRQIWSMLNEKNFPVPGEYSERCLRCNK